MQKTIETAVSLVYATGSQRVGAVEEMVTALLTKAGCTMFHVVFVQPSKGKFSDGIELLRLGEDKDVTLRVKPKGKSASLVVLTYDEPERASLIRGLIATALKPEEEAVEPGEVRDALATDTPGRILVRAGAPKLEVANIMVDEELRRQKKARDKDQLHFSLVFNVLAQGVAPSAVDLDELEVIESIAASIGTEPNLQEFLRNCMVEVSPGVFSVKQNVRTRIRERLEDTDDSMAQDLLEGTGVVLGESLHHQSGWRETYPGLAELIPWLLGEFYSMGYAELIAVPETACSDLIGVKLRLPGQKLPNSKKRVSVERLFKPEAWSGEFDKATERLIDRDRRIASLIAGEPAQPVFV